MLGWAPPGNPTVEPSHARLGITRKPTVEPSHARLGITPLQSRAMLGCGSPRKASAEHGSALHADNYQEHPLPSTARHYPGLVLGDAVDFGQAGGALRRLQQC